MTTTKNNRRVVVTGMGWVTPLGHDVDTVWKRLLNSESGMGPTTRFDARTFPTTFAAEVRDYDVNAFVKHPQAHATAGLNSKYALGAARQAWAQAGLDERPAPSLRRVGMYLGAGEGVIDTANYFAANVAGWDAASNRVGGAWFDAAQRMLDRAREVEQEPNMPLAHLAREFGIRGPALNCLTACAASTQAIGEAFSLIQRGDADVMIAGGSEATVSPLGVGGFAAMRALSTGTPARRKARAKPVRLSAILPLRTSPSCMTSNGV
mgnify:CR=1 FL=1